MIATGRSDEKLAQVKDMGADHVINTSPRNGEAGVPTFRDDVKALTGGRGVEVVFDTVGGDVSQESLRSLAFAAEWSSSAGRAIPPWRKAVVSAARTTLIGCRRTSCR